MTEQDAITTESEQRSSIEVSRNAKGEHAYKVKLYFDNDAEGAEMRAALSRIERIMADLDATYGH